MTRILQVYNSNIYLTLETLPSSQALDIDSNDAVSSQELNEIACRKTALDAREGLTRQSTRSTEDNGQVLEYLSDQESDTSSGLDEPQSFGYPYPYYVNERLSDYFAAKAREQLEESRTTEVLLQELQQINSRNSAEEQEAQQQEPISNVWKNTVYPDDLAKLKSISERKKRLHIN
ncbi:MAG: hypothetical protein Q9225_002647 [Loekoesia sp. 1 TL-2023]